MADTARLAALLRDVPTIRVLTQRLGKFNDAWWNRFADELLAAGVTAASTPDLALDLGPSCRGESPDGPCDDEACEAHAPTPDPSCCELACYEDEGCACDGCAPTPDPLRDAAQAVVDGLDELMDEENAPAAHGRWTSTAHSMGEESVILSDDDGCDLFIDPWEVAALVRGAVALRAALAKEAEG